MADFYVADSVYSKYVMAYGDDAKAEMRDVLADHAPETGGDTDE
jgi:hypothetical protein